MSKEARWYPHTTGRGRPGYRQLGHDLLRSSPASALAITHEVDPDFLEQLRRETIEQPELPWEA